LESVILEKLICLVYWERVNTLLQNIPIIKLAGMSIIKLLTEFILALSVWVTIVEVEFGMRVSVGLYYGKYKRKNYRSFHISTSLEVMQYEIVCSYVNMIT
jgi:hypothetical protein